MRTYKSIYGCVNHACGCCSAERLQEIVCDGVKDAFSYEEIHTMFKCLEDIFKFLQIMFGNLCFAKFR